MPASSTPPATENYEQQVGWLRRNISEADEGGGALTMGVLPARSIVVGAGVIVATGFNGTSPILQIGTSGDGDGFATNLILATIGNIVWDELATSNDLYKDQQCRFASRMMSCGTTFIRAAAP